MFFVVDEVGLILLDGCLALWLFGFYFAVDLPEEVFDQFLLQIRDFEAVTDLEQTIVELEADPAGRLPIEEVPLFCLRNIHVQVVIGLYCEELYGSGLRQIVFLFFLVVAVGWWLCDLEQRVYGNRSRRIAGVFEMVEPSYEALHSEQINISCAVDC